MNIGKRILASSLVAAAIVGLMMGGTAFARPAATPEMDPGMAVSGLTILGMGLVLFLERYRRN